MNDSVVGASSASEGAAAAPLTAGGLLRQARQVRGLHIAALATSIKVSPHKLELLETDRFDELPGATFTRALAQTVCRSLKIDSAPVLALLPHVPRHGLEHVSRGLNEPFRDRPGRRVPDDLQFIKNPVVLSAVLLGVFALAIYLLPSSWIGAHLDQPASRAADNLAPPAVPASAAAVPAEVAPPATAAPAEPGAVVETVFSSAVEPSGDAASVPASSLASVSGALQMQVSAESWVEVIDRSGAVLLSRMLQPGEIVGLDGASPLRIKIGNASATQVTYKGDTIDLVPVTTRDNVAKLELR